MEAMSVSTWWRPEEVLGVDVSDVRQAHHTYLEVLGGHCYSERH
jgi:hypothetical protein